MASPGSYIRSAARVTFSAYRRVPIRWRLAGGSAALTFVILATFAVVVGILTTRQFRQEFYDQQTSAVGRLDGALTGHLAWSRRDPFKLDLGHVSVALNGAALGERAQIRIFDAASGAQLASQLSLVKGEKAPVAAHLFRTMPTAAAVKLLSEGWASVVYDQSNYRVEVKALAVPPLGQVLLLYAVPLSDLQHTLAQVEVFLLLGVVGGTILALLAGLFLSARAMRPIVELTEAAREIERTRDPSLHVPHPEADDEVAELAGTLEGMLAALDSARSETEAMLARQREFVADASHELRTPLTSVLANLELLTEELGGEQAETAEAALRSTRRMRRLVGDLLLLARADARRVQPQRPTDLAEVMLEAAAELGPMADNHELSISAEAVVVAGVRDELHRLILNLLENAVRHTPPGTSVRASTSVRDGVAEIVVEDDGPGIAPALAARVFERFVRGGRDGGKGSGLGLAIVRSVAQSHGGDVTLRAPEQSASGTRFEITIPLAREQPVAEEPAAGAVAEIQTSTTTGRTIGRRRSRS